MDSEWDDWVITAKFCTNGCLYYSSSRAKGDNKVATPGQPTRAKQSQRDFDRNTHCVVSFYSMSASRGSKLIGLCVVCDPTIGRAGEDNHQYKHS